MFELNTLLIERKKPKYDKLLSLIWIVLLNIFFFGIVSGHGHGLGHYSLLEQLNNPLLNKIFISIFIVLVILTIIRFLPNQMEIIGKLILKEESITVISNSQNIEYKLSDISLLNIGKKEKQDYEIKFTSKDNSHQFLFRLDPQRQIIYPSINEIRDLWKKSHPNAFDF